MFDDDIELLDAIHDALVERGYTVSAFSSPREALAALEGQDFDVLLSDLMMPEMSGIEVLQKGLELDPNLVGIIMTGQATVQTAVDAMKVGAFDYVMKPFKLNALLPVINRALDVRRMKKDNLQLREMLAIYELGQTIGQTWDLNAVLNKVAEAAMQQVQATESSVMLITPDGSELVIASVKGAGVEGLLGERIPIDRGVAGWVARNRQPVILDGTVDDPRFAPVKPRPEIQSSISMPLLSGNKLVGVLNANSTESRTRFTLGRAKALSILCNIAASVVEGASLYAEARQAGESLRVAEAKYRGIFENAVEGIFQSTPEGGYLTVNPALARMYGCDSPEELIGSVRDLSKGFYVEPNRRAEFKRMLEENDAVFNFESQVHRKDGSIIWILENARAVRDERGTLLNHEGTTEDITARKQAEEELLATNLRLQSALEQLRVAQASMIQQERLRALGELASGIAHDFNNALGPVLGFSEILLMRPESIDDREKTLRYLKLMNTSARDAAAVVSRLREFYRKRDEAEVLVSVNLAQLVEQAISLTQPKWKDQALAAGRMVRIESDLREVSPIAGNEHELREVLTNLILNAVDAMPEGGTIRITTRIGECPTLDPSREKWRNGETDSLAAGGSPTLPLFPDGSNVGHSPTHVVLSVEDTGTGMPDEVRQRCLEPFFSTKGERGTGLGLSMVHGIVQRHEGTVEIESELGRGTRFILRFPVLLSSESTGAKTTTDVVRPLSVLLVDDEPLVRETIQEYLTGDGHKVQTAADGREALQKFNAGRFDLVITDRAMPEMSGDQLAAAIKQIASRRVGIIMFTGFGDLMRSTGELPEGVDYLLSKPCTMNGLRAAVAEVTKA